MKYEMFTKRKVFFYLVGSWHAPYRLHPRILPDLRNLAKLGHAKLYPTFCWTLYMSSNQQNLTIGSMSIGLKSDYRRVKISLTTGLGSYPEKYAFTKCQRLCYLPI